MKSERLYEAIGEVDEKLVSEAEKYTPSGKKKSLIAVVISLAAVIAVALALGIVHQSGFFSPDVNPPAETATGTENREPQPTQAPGKDKEVKPVALAKAEYPGMARYPFLGELDPSFSKWAESRRELRGIEVETDSITGFSRELMAQLLTEKKDENNIVSPLNLYMALSVLSEACDGNSRQQILDLLGENSVEELRVKANKIWQKNYRDDGAMKSIMANSLWLNNIVRYNKSTVNTIAEKYFASVFSGAPGTEKYNKMLNNWISDNTDGLLKPDIKMNADTVMAIASTLIYATKWTDEFSPSKTESGVFHSPEGDVTASYMKASRDMHYFWGEKYAAINLSLNIGGHMWFILPDEGVDADEIFSDDQLLELVTMKDIYRESENNKYIKVNMSIPKFDAKSERNVIEGLKALGITDVTDSTLSDFSPLAENPEGIFIDEVSHGVRVKIDEEGVQAAAYTVIRGAGAAAPPDDEVDFVLDRPFAFVITLDGTTPLFAGVINNP